MAAVKVTPTLLKEVRDRLRPAFGPDEREIVEEVKAGVAQCWTIGKAAMITRREGDELVVVCLAGEGLKDIAPLICKAAKQAGCKTLRFHTKRPGLYRLLSNIGAELREYVFEVKI